MPIRSHRPRCRSRHDASRGAEGSDALVNPSHGSRPRGIRFRSSAAAPDGAQPAGAHAAPSTRVAHRGPSSARTLAVTAVLTLCVTTALVVGVGWSIGKNLRESTATAASPAAAWNGTHGMVTTASETDAEALRSQGWTLPTLSTAGYRVVSMARGEVSGQPMVEITLDNEHNTVQVIEQRGRVDPGNPVDGVTGLPVSAEGLRDSAVAGARLWVVRSQPWRAVLAGSDVVYTVTSDASPSALSRILTLVAAEERGRVALPGSDPEPFADTVLAGLREIFR